MKKAMRCIFVAGLFSCAVITVACQETTQKTDPEKVLPSPIPRVKVTFIELGSVNCIPCQAMQLVMKDIERDYGDQVKIVFYDVWTEAGQPYGVFYKIRAIPTQVFLDENGREYFRHEGYFPKEELVKILMQKGVR
jgi:thioredoxin 1